MTDHERPQGFDERLVDDEQPEGCNDARYHTHIDSGEDMLTLNPDHPDNRFAGLEARYVKVSDVNEQLYGGEDEASAAEPSYTHTGRAYMVDEKTIIQMSIGFHYLLGIARGAGHAPPPNITEPFRQVIEAAEAATR